MLDVVFILNKNDWEGLENVIKSCITTNSSYFGFNIGHEFRRFCYAGPTHYCPFKQDSAYFQPYCMRPHYKYEVQENGQTGDIYVGEENGN